MILYPKKEFVMTHANHCCVIFRSEPMKLLYNTLSLVGRHWDEPVASVAIYGEALWGYFAPIDEWFVHR